MVNDMSALLSSTRPLCPYSAGTLMTAEEFDAVEEWDESYAYELIHGVLVVTPIPLESEADPNDELGMWLREYRRDNPQGFHMDATLPERHVKTKSQRRRADRVIWIGLGRIPDPDVDVPKIAVEFVSDSKRDRGRDYEEKKEEYPEAGIEEYWIIDRSKRTMTVVRMQPGQGPLELTILEHETYRPPLLPGFELPLAQLLAIADRWGKTE